VARRVSMPAADDLFRPVSRPDPFLFGTDIAPAPIAAACPNADRRGARPPRAVAFP